MASRIMHLAVSRELEKLISTENVNDFRIGQILPDAVIGGDKKQANTHFIKNFSENGKSYKIYDYYGFYDGYGELLLNGNEMLLGYYFHLIQDNIFRILLYGDLKMLHRRGNRDFLSELYKDYHILNGILIKRYGMKNDLRIPDNFTECKINNIYNFELTDFLKELDKDFSGNDSGELKIFKGKAADEFIRRCVAVCKSEYDCLLNQNRHYLSEKELAFEI